MTKTFDMQFIRYINIFGRVTQVPAKHCFAYNNMIVFVVPAAGVQMAIGRNNSNLKKLSAIIEKRVRIVSQPRGIGDLQGFVATIISPAQFEKLEVAEKTDSGQKEAIITTNGRENKAMLIGRERARERELKDILEQYFGIKGLRIL